MKYRLIQDNDGHWYVIPASEGMEMLFDQWVKAMDSGIFTDPYGDQMEFPPFESKMVDGPHSVTFEKYEVR